MYSHMQIRIICSLMAATALLITFSPARADDSDDSYEDPYSWEKEREKSSTYESPFERARREWKDETPREERFKTYDPDPPRELSNSWEDDRRRSSLSGIQSRQLEPR